MMMPYIITNYSYNTKLIAAMNGETCIVVPYNNGRIYVNPDE
jgi:hypothetical protein